jgi:hypothetical protein
LERFTPREHIKHATSRNTNHTVLERDVVLFSLLALETLAIERKNVHGKELQVVITSRMFAHGETKLHKSNKRDVVTPLINVLEKFVN